MNQAKGAVVNSYLKFIKRKWGVHGVQEAMRYAGIAGHVRDSEWFPMEKTDRVLEWIAKNKGMEYVVEAGRYAPKNMGVFTSFFAAVIGIEKMLRRAEDTYRTVFNFGEIHITIGKNRAVVVIRGARLTDYSCPAWKGALEGIMEVTRTMGTVKSVEPDSPDDCKFVLEWA